jgi:putative transposase
MVGYETLRDWCARFGLSVADGRRQGWARPAEKWHRDDAQLKVKDKQNWGS